MSSLLTAACTPGCPPLDGGELEAQLSELPDWQLVDGALQASFRFDNFREVMDFANAVAEIAEAQDHHPDLILSHAMATVRWHTHRPVRAITRNDLICAAQVSHLPEAHP